MNGNFDTVCNDTLLKEVFPKLNLNALMNLRKTSHRYRVLVSTYLRISTDTITMINIVRDGINLYSITDIVAWFPHFITKMKQNGAVFDREKHGKSIERWCSGERAIVVDKGDYNFFYTRSGESQLWSLDNVDYQVKDENIATYLYQMFIAKDDEDEESTFDYDTTLVYFHQGVQIENCPVYLCDEETKNIKKIQNFINRCKKIGDCIQII